MPHFPPHAVRDAAVKAQYETLPYPPRDPRDEAKRLLIGSPSHLAEIEHYVFGGRLPRDGSLRILFAGGGSGDALVMAAQQLATAGITAELVHLDLSAAAQAVAAKRLAARGLPNARFVQGSLTELALLGLGAFDYIDCCGVLHHLEDPDAGLATLADALSPRGGIGLMVYGALGRAGVYDLQEALAPLAPITLPPAERLVLAKKLLAGLPPTNRLKRNPFITDHLAAGDAGIYDLLLHPRDRAYRVEQVFDLIAGAGLRLQSLIEPARYAPETYVNDPKLRVAFAALDPCGRARAAERIAGNISRHIAYAVRPDGVAPPRLNDAGAVPVFRDQDGAAWAQATAADRALTGDFDRCPAQFPLPTLAPALLRLVDGVRTLDEIHAALAATRPDVDRAAFDRAFASLYAAFNGANQMLLRLR